LTRILYFAHDLDDAAIWRRCKMLHDGGAEVDLVGFRRRDGPLPGPAKVLGKTRNARMGQRVYAIARARTGLATTLQGLDRPDVMLARNLETLPLALAAAGKFASPARPQVVYEVLDIHRLMLRSDAVGRALRAVERRLMQGVDHILVSSSAFERNYFDQLHTAAPPVHLVENRVVLPKDSHLAMQHREGRAHPSGPLVVGWFGILRCRASLHCLDAVTRIAPGRLRVILRGRPARDELPEFDTVVAENPDIDFGGAYSYPEDLPRIYGEVDLAWLVDRYDAGQNSDWLMPNRYYESGFAGVPPVALSGTEVGREMARHGIGLLLEGMDPDAVARTFAAVTSERYAALCRAQRSVSQATWVAGPDDARALVARFRGDADTASTVTGDEVRA
jgi:succinoglycan biosynthesis protein ExoL